MKLGTEVKGGRRERGGGKEGGEEEEKGRRERGGEGNSLQVSTKIMELCLLLQPSLIPRPHPLTRKWVW